MEIRECERYTAELSALFRKLHRDNRLSTSILGYILGGEKRADARQETIDKIIDLTAQPNAKKILPALQEFYQNQKSTNVPSAKRTLRKAIAASLLLGTAAAIRNVCYITFATAKASLWLQDHPDGVDPGIQLANNRLWFYSAVAAPLVIGAATYATSRISESFRRKRELAHLNKGLEEIISETDAPVTTTTPTEIPSALISEVIHHPPRNLKQLVDALARISCHTPTYPDASKVYIPEPIKKVNYKKAAVVGAAAGALIGAAHTFFTYHDIPINARNVLYFQDSLVNSTTIDMLRGVGTSLADYLSTGKFLAYATLGATANVAWKTLAKTARTALNNLI